MTGTVVSSGRLRGRRLETPDGVARAFLGVPYAGDAARFRPAPPVEAWSGSREAVRSGPSAPQTSGGSESGCLTVNVWTPDAAAGSPVLVWIHGGLHVAGSNAEPFCDGARLAARTGTVVVAVNHRLGALGFLTLDHLLGQEYRDSANLGLHDVIAALEWVRDEIAAFGGDPARVTLAGQSAGATSAAMLLAAPRAEGLFSRAVLQSANPERIGSRRYGEDVTAELLGLLGAAPERLLDLPWPHLIEAQDRLLAQRSAAGPNTVAVLRPSLDGRLLTRDPVSAVAEGASSGVDLIVTTNVNEGSGAVDLRAPDAAELRAQLDRHLGALLPGGSAGSYRWALAADLERTPTDAEALEACLADEIYRQPSQRLLDARAAATGSTRAALFAWRADDTRGATHSLELPFLFRSLDTARDEVGPGAPQRLSDEVSARWAAFAASGDPGWPDYGTERTTLVLDDPVRVVDAPREHLRRLVASHRH
ncbi:carboxylesterase family protein [Rathayibacter sp. VKM Ac-2801]|uniref:carboxylesterase/lipase family protein n=1 Tax=Rathayibacter sp. VKM Ac-2801 TaxID=2609255 RepID=UPI00131F5396|nr:carboxylesterase family protein [Rathayibacter sp. VKM Ac-2801]QHC69222.1 carboxylesterase family protein [Rathayibacter sp. VKM Ac-2801]